MVRRALATLLTAGISFAVPAAAATGCDGRCPDRVTARVSSGEQANATVIDGDSVYLVGSWRGAQAAVTRLDARQQRTVWTVRSNLPGATNLYGAAHDPARHLLFVSGHRFPNPDKDQTQTLTAALDDRTGKVLWQRLGPVGTTFFEGGRHLLLNPGGLLLDVQGHGQPKAANGYQRFLPSVVAWTPGGKVAWVWHETLTGDQISATTATLVGNTLVLAGSRYDNGLYAYVTALDIRTGKRLWTRPTGERNAEVRAVTVVGTDLVFAADALVGNSVGKPGKIETVLQRLTATTGSIRWTRRVIDPDRSIIPAALTTDGTTLALGGAWQGRALLPGVAERGGWLATLDARTGRTTWSSTSRPGTVQVVALDSGWLYATDRREHYRYRGTELPTYVNGADEVARLSTSATRLTDHALMWESAIEGRGVASQTRAVTLRPLLDGTRRGVELVRDVTVSNDQNRLEDLRYLR